MTTSTFSSRHPHIRLYVSEHADGGSQAAGWAPAGRYVTTSAKSAERPGSYVTTSALPSGPVGTYVTTRAKPSGPVDSYVSCAKR